MTEQYQLLPLDVKNASPAEYAALNRHNNILRGERLPDDLPILLDEYIQGMHNLPDFVEVKMWCAWDSARSEIIAQGNVALLHTPENQHLTQIDITVQPAYRRQGLCRRLLGLTTEAARLDNRRLIVFESYDRVPAGEAFLTRLGAKKGLEAHTNQLRLDELDRSLVERWLAQGEGQAGEFELGLWEGPYPEEQIKAVVVGSEEFRLRVEDEKYTMRRLEELDRLSCPGVVPRGIERSKV